MRKEDEFQIAEPLELRRERSCISDLLWRCELPEEVNLEEVRRELHRCGCVQRGASSPLPLWVFFTAQGHRILLVPATRRLQLRLNYELPKPERSNAARELAILLRDACTEARSQKD